MEIINSPLFFETLKNISFSKFPLLKNRNIQRKHVEQKFKNYRPNSEE